MTGTLHFIFHTRKRPSVRKVFIICPYIMKKLVKTLRTIVLIILILLAVAGIAIVPIFPREEPMRKRTTVDLVERREEEEELP